MKNLFVLLVLTFCISGAFAQSRGIQPPETVSAAFTEKFPNVIPLKWSQTKQRAFKTYFNLDGNKSVAYFTPDGKWYRTIMIYDVPPAIVEDYISREYDYPEVKKTTYNESRKRLYYSTLIDTGAEYHKLYLSETGELLNKKTKMKTSR